VAQMVPIPSAERQIQLTIRHYKEFGKEKLMAYAVPIKTYSAYGLTARHQ